MKQNKIICTEFKNLTKNELIRELNKVFINLQKSYKIPKKYWIKPIIDMKLNDLNYYSTINNHTLVHINKEYASYYYQFKYKKPLLYAVVSTNTNPDLKISAKVFTTIKSDDLIVNKYKGISHLLIDYYLYSEDNYTYRQYKKFNKQYTDKKNAPDDEEVYELENSLINYDYTQNLKIKIKLYVSKIFEYKFIEMFIWDSAVDKTLYMGKAFYNNNNTTNELLYDLITDGLNNFRFTNKSKIDFGNIILKLSVFLKSLKENNNKKLNFKLQPIKSYYTFV